MPLDFNEIRQLLTTIAQTDIAEVTLKSDDFELTVRKAVSVSPMLSAPPQAALGAVGTPNTPVPPPIPLVMSPQTVTVTSPNRPTDSNTLGLQSPPTGSSVIEQKFVEIPSPMVGTFYRSPSPGEAPFVQVGDRIRSGQTVCIIEAMKLMNEIEAEVSGQVIEILVQNGQPVEYGQPLMRINPD
ncbi:acetyl-CoA carboxylase biotin carboxyl carrier protein [Brasilonema bromeliae]|uniref:Biotin carboxyl carrier protein of acetyl-CoA carboxylase n=1 Tax=Brasilonema bromeliae SPC951 TaxID=385972 RepID=A0ABX1P608_9CYAN|nr:acetyl-CoA carboxylase, biotin carboxyl carrier protein [Brasilonema bromeliae SPC951]